MNSSTRGSLAAILAYITWGLFPIYFKQIVGIVAIDVIAWRIFFSCLFLFAVLLIWLRPGKFIRRVRLIDQWWLLLGSTLLLSSNWLVFVYAIETDQVLQSSMGYFLVPIVSVGLGMMVFHERPNRLKLIAVAIAVTGMLLTFIVAGVVAGQFPWIAIVLGVTFGIYGMFRKKAKFDAVIGLWMETVLLMPVAIIYILFFCEPLDELSVVSRYWLYLIGLVTSVPLVAMLFAARRIELSSLGFYQYITPCMHLLLAVMVYKETLDLARMMALATTLLAVLFWLFGSVKQLSRKSFQA